MELVGKLTFKMLDTNAGNANVTGLGCDNFNSLLDSDTAVTYATKIDTFGRALTALTTNTYNDVEISAKTSAVEILAEE